MDSIDMTKEASRKSLRRWIHKNLQQNKIPVYQCQINKAYRLIQFTPYIPATTALFENKFQKEVNSQKPPQQTMMLHPYKVL